MKFPPRHFYLFCVALWSAFLTPSLRGDVLINEILVNPPGPDAPNEYIELRGTPNLLLTNLYFLAVDGNTAADPGTVIYALNLANEQLGSNGLLLITSTNATYTPAGDTALCHDPQLSQSGGMLGNGSISFLLVSGTNQFQPGLDLDKGNTGVLQGLPTGASIVDAVGWKDGDKNDLVYGGATLVLPGITPDAATRLPGNNNPCSATAWICGDVTGSDFQRLAYDLARASSNVTAGTTLTPGTVNNTAPFFAPVAPISGVIGDPTNPEIPFSVFDVESGTNRLIITATSSNQQVVPDTNLLLSVDTSGIGTVQLKPIGIGYSEITLLASDGSMTGHTAFPYAASSPGRPGTVWHLGASDGSTAIPVDQEYALIGDDENQTIRLYRRHQSGLPVSEFDMTSNLALPDVKPGLVREVDVEASTHVGARQFWLGSHGHATDGEPRTNRTRIFTTETLGLGAATSLTYIGRYDFLKLDLINWDSRNLHGKGTNYYGLEASDAPGVSPKAPDGSGFAIEGLAIMPGNTNGAYVAFRAPIVPATNRTFALIVPVLNFATVAASTCPPGSCIFGAPIELDLYGRGIRSLEGGPGGYILIGGPAQAGIGKYPKDFRLYTWSGFATDTPDQRAADLSGLTPEGIVELPSTPWQINSQVELLSDNGSTEFYGDAVPAKLLTIPNFKKCRTDTVLLGAVTKPMPVILYADHGSNDLRITWRALKGVTYRMQRTGDPSSGGWEDVPGDVQAGGPYATKAVPLSVSAAFYRLAVLP